MLCHDEFYFCCFIVINQGKVKCFFLLSCIIWTALFKVLWQPCRNGISKITGWFVVPPSGNWVSGGPNYFQLARDILNTINVPISLSSWLESWSCERWPWIFEEVPKWKDSIRSFSTICLDNIKIEKNNFTISGIINIGYQKYCVSEISGIRNIGYQNFLVSEILGISNIGYQKYRVSKI